MQFTKPHMSPNALLRKVQARGLGEISSSAEQLLFFDALKRLGYYRLTGYFLAYQDTKSAIDPHKFLAGTTFKQVLELAEFDTAMRNLSLDALGKIEVALRTSICDFMCATYGTHWYQNASAFSIGKMQGVLEEAANHLDYDLAANRPYRQATNKDGHLFLQHYYAKYTKPAMPPAWMLREVASFGFWARTYEALQQKDQKRIADSWLFPDGARIDHALLSNWLWSLSILRNRCAHHARITNRKFPFPPNAPKSNSANQYFGPKTNDLKTLFDVMTLLLRSVSKKDAWTHKVANTLGVCAAEN